MVWRRVRVNGISTSGGSTREPLADWLWPDSSAVWDDPGTRNGCTRGAAAMHLVCRPLDALVSCDRLWGRHRHKFCSEKHAQVGLHLLGMLASLLLAAGRGAVAKGKRLGAAWRRPTCPIARSGIPAACNACRGLASTSGTGQAAHLLLGGQLRQALLPCLFLARRLPRRRPLRHQPLLLRLLPRPLQVLLAALIQLLLAAQQVALRQRHRGNLRSPWTGSGEERVWCAQDVIDDAAMDWGWLLLLMRERTQGA